MLFRAKITVKGKRTFTTSHDCAHRGEAVKMWRALFPNAKVQMLDVGLPAKGTVRNIRNGWDSCNELCGEYK